MLQLTTAPPNPVTDNMTDRSHELSSNYKYPDLEAAKEPYWKAWDTPTKRKLKRHDDMEMAMSTLRRLEFKLREAWTPTDKPFNNHD